MKFARCAVRQQFGYAFDSIGNRESTTAGGDQAGSNLRSASYIANNLNQYTSRTVPAAVDIIGSATNAATVTVNGETAYRHDDYYRAELGVANSAGPVFAAVTNVATLTVDTNSVFTNLVGNVFIPQSPENFSYDADGNLTNDGRWAYSWDAKNRLVGMTNNGNVPEGARLTLSFAYDYLGRRIQKTVSTYNPSTTGYETSLRNSFVYDGWNLQAELNETNGAVVRSYVWGLDLSGTPQSAGGVGGLLWTFQPQLGNARAFVTHDANGNVSTLVYCSDGQSIGHYEYGPFGELLRATGPMAKANPFRFSTKYQDDETDLLYYGYRYFSATVGRWLSVDPMQERGGRNRYGFARNSPLNAIDKLGLSTIRVEETIDDSVDRGKAALLFVQQALRLEFYLKRTCCDKFCIGCNTHVGGRIMPDIPHVPNGGWTYATLPLPFLRPSDHVPVFLTSAYGVGFPGDTLPDRGNSTFDRLRRSAHFRSTCARSWTLGRVRRRPQRHTFLGPV